MGSFGFASVSTQRSCVELVSRSLRVLKGGAFNKQTVFQRAYEYDSSQQKESEGCPC